MAKENMVNAKISHSVLLVIRNSIAWHAICLLYLSSFLIQSDRLKQVRTIETAHWDLVKGDRDRFIEVTA